MVRIVGRYTHPDSQEGLNITASEGAHHKGVQWSLTSGRRGTIRNMPHGEFP